MLGSVDAEVVHAVDLHHPLRVPHEQAGGVLADGVAGRRVVQVERVDLNPTLAGDGVEHADRVQVAVGVEAAVRLGRDVRQSSRTVRRLTGVGQVAAVVSRDGTEAGHGVSNEPKVLAVVDIDKPGKPTAQVAVVKRAVEIAVGAGDAEHAAVVVRVLTQKAGVAAGLLKPGRAVVAEAVVVDDQIDTNKGAGSMKRVGRLSEAGLGAVKRRPPRPAQIKAIVHVVADGEVGQVGPPGGGSQTRP